MRTEIDSQQKALEFLDSLASSASDYVAVINSNHTKWNAYGTATRRHIHTINHHLRVEQIRPLLFAVAKHFSVKEAQKAFKLLVSWSVRFLIAGGRGGLLDRNYALAAQQIGTGKIKTTKELAKSMQDVVPTDAVFQAAFAEVRISQTFLARYFLRALEMKLKNDPEPELIPNEDQEVINLEHVLPENPGTNWPSIDPEVAAAVYRRVGDMVLLKATPNAVIGNQPFAAKKPTIAASGYELTKGVADKQLWGVKEIQERQTELAALAVQTWPLS